LKNGDFIMKKNQYDEGRLTAKGQGLGTVTETMVRQRAAEIAEINGRPRHRVIESDVDQARRELMGQERLNPERPRSERIPEEARWQPEGGSAGRKAPAVPAQDEQTFAEKLVEEGVAEAEHDQQVKATRESFKRDTK
jgi:hypothetical protein